MTGAQLETKIRESLKPHHQTRFTAADIREEVNRGLNDFCAATFALVKTKTYSSEASKRDYDLPSDFLDMKNVFWDNKPLRYRSVMEMNSLFNGSSSEMSRTGTPYIYWFPIHGRMALHPLPDEAKTTANMVSAVSAGRTTLAVDSTSGFNESGFFLVSDAGEVAHYFAKSSNEFRLVVRGEEETVSETIASAVTLNEHNIQMAYYARDLGVSIATDSPQIPEEYHMCITDYVVSELLGQFDNEGQKAQMHKNKYYLVREEAKGDVKRMQKTNLPRVRNTFFNDGGTYY